MTAPIRPPVEPVNRQARLATSLIFAFNGLLFAAWVPHIPEVKANLGLSNAELGFALLGPAAGSIASMTVIGRAATRFGSGALTKAMAFGCYLVAPLSGLADNLPTLFGALFAWGVMTGGLDVAMNAQAVQIESRYRRPIMSSFHGFWSLGSVAGTLIGGAGAGLGLSLARQQTGIAVALAVITAVVAGRLLTDRTPPQERSTKTRVIDFRLVLLGIAGLCALLAEGSSADWSPIYLRDHLHVSAGQAGIAYTAFTIMMMTGRGIGDRVVHRLGRGPSLTLMGAIGTAGMAAGLAGDSLITSCLGFACLGLGLSIMVPVFFSAAADGDGPPAPRLAVVTSVGYFGFLIGPAALGPLASATSVHAALWVLPAFIALATGLGAIAFRLRPTPKPARPPTAPKLPPTPAKTAGTTPPGPRSDR
jgi:MFS family permease